MDTKTEDAPSRSDDAERQTKDKLWDEWKDSVVKIKTDTSSGTGFFVDRNTIATNYHVIKGSRHFRAQDSSENWYTLGEHVFADPQHDLALLKIHGPGPKHVKPISIAPGDLDRTGSRLFHIGHPLGQELKMIEGLARGRSDERAFYTATQAAVSPRRQVAQEAMMKDPANRNFLTQPLLIVEAPGVTHGSSGAPFLDENGNVVAVVRKGVRNQDGIIYCAPGSFLNRLVANSNNPSAVDLPKDEFFAVSGHYETGVENYFSSLRHTPGVFLRDSVPIGIAGAGAWLSRNPTINDFMEKRSPVRLNVGLSIAGLALVPITASDIRGFCEARDSLSETKYALALGADASTAAGFTQKTFANAMKSRPFATTLGRAGIAVGAVGIVGRLATEFIPHHYSVTIPHFDIPKH